MRKFMSVVLIHELTRAPELSDAIRPGIEQCHDTARAIAISDHAVNCPNLIISPVNPQSLTR